MYKSTQVISVETDEYPQTHQCDHNHSQEIGYRQQFRNPCHYSPRHSTNRLSLFTFSKLIF